MPPALHFSNSNSNLMKTNSLFLAILCVTFLSIGNAMAQKDEDKVKKVLNEYKSAIEKLDTVGTVKLFANKSQVIESGKIEGTYHHEDISNEI